MKVILYGKEGIGKSTFASMFKDPLFVATEAGLTGLSVFQVHEDGSTVKDWEEFRALCVHLATTPHDWGTVVVDTLDNVTRLAVEYTEKRHNVDQLHGQRSSAALWGFVKKQVTEALETLMSGPYGVILISHEKDVTIEAATGREVGMMDRPKGEVFTRHVPSGGSAYRATKGAADLILRCAMDLRTGDRVLECQPTPSHIAKDRTDVLPPVLPLCYSSFLDCFRDALKKEKTKK
jgi:hypothetical protein